MKLRLKIVHTHHKPHNSYSVSLQPHTQSLPLTCPSTFSPGNMASPLLTREVWVVRLSTALLDTLATSSLSSLSCALETTSCVATSTDRAVTWRSCVCVCVCVCVCGCVCVCVYVYVCVCALFTSNYNYSYWFCIVYANYEVGFLSFTSKYRI